MELDFFLLLVYNNDLQLIVCSHSLNSMRQPPTGDENKHGDQQRSNAWRATVPTVGRLLLERKVVSLSDVVQSMPERFMRACFLTLERAVRVVFSEPARLLHP